MRLRLLSAFALMGMSVLAVRAEPAAPGVAPDYIRLANIVSEAVVNPTTGDLLVLEAGSDTVALYPAYSGGNRAPEAVRKKIAAGPCSAVFKATPKESCFAVLSRGAKPVVTLLDPVKLEVIKEIPLERAGGDSLCASGNPQDPFIYYTCGGGHDSTIRAISLKSRTDVGIDVLKTNGSISDASISPDGQVLYPLGPWSPRGFESVQMDFSQSIPSGSTLKYEHNTRGKVRCDPFNRFAAAAMSVYTRDLAKRVADLKVGPVLAWAADRPLVFCGEQGRGARLGQSIAAYSANTFQQVGESVIVPMEDGALVDYAFVDRYRTDALYDGKGGVLYLLRARTIAAIPVAAFKAPVEPLLVADIDGPARIAVDTPLNLTVKLRDPAVKAELVNAPKGMTLARGAITWTPGNGDVGASNVGLRLSAGQMQFQQDFCVVVTQPEISLTFAPQFTAFAADGTGIAACNGVESPIIPKPPEAQTRLALVDLNTCVMTAQRRMSASISGVAIDARHVYVALRDSKAVLTLSRKDLTDTERLAVPGKPLALALLGDRLHVVTAVGTTVVDAEKLGVLSDTPAGTPRTESSAAPLVQQIHTDARAAAGPACLVDGVVWDADGQRILALTHPPGLHRVALNLPARMPWADAELYLPAFAPWGVRVVSRLAPDPFMQATLPALQRVGGQELPIAAASAVVSWNQPMAAALLADPAFTVGEVQFHDLATGAVVASRRLFSVTPEMARIDNLQKTTVVQAPRSGQFIATFGTRMYPVPAPKLDRACAVPLHFQPDIGVAELPATGPVRVKIAAVGGESPVEYSLVGENKGIELDKKAGVLTIQREPVLPKLIEALAAMAGPDVKDFPGRLDMAGYKPQAAARYKALTGHEASGLGVYFIITVYAGDKSGQKAAVHLPVLVDVPMEPIQVRYREMAEKGL